MRRVIYPGTFDPVTLGHLDVIERAVRLFGALTVAVGNNPAKKSLFSLRERTAMVREAVRHIRNVSVHSFNGLLVNFAKRMRASAVIRGIRTVSDFEYELQMALTNRTVTGLETLFVTPRPEYQFFSAQLIREIASMGGDIAGMVPPCVVARVQAKLGKRRRRAAGGEQP